jgi:hypothetical protein
MVHANDWKERRSRIIMNSSPLLAADEGKRRETHHLVSGKRFDPVPEHHA